MITLVEQTGVFLELEVEASERGAAVAGYQGSSTEAGSAIGAVLVHGETDQCLDAGEKDGAFFGCVF